MQFQEKPKTKDDGRGVGDGLW